MIPLIQLFPTLAAGPRMSEATRRPQKLATFERGSFWMMDLSPRNSASLTLKTLAPASFGELHRNEADQLSRAMQLSDPVPVLQRLASGKRVFGAYLEGELAAYGWVSTSAECIGEIEHEIKLGSDEAYIWDCATLVPYRRLGLYSALLEYITAQLGWEGVKRVWIGSSMGNRPSLLGFAKAGFHPIIRLFYLRLFGLSQMWLSPAPAASKDLVAAGRQVLSDGWAAHWGSLSLDYSVQAARGMPEGTSCSGSLPHEVDLPESEGYPG